MKVSMSYSQPTKNVVCHVPITLGKARMFPERRRKSGDSIHGFFQNHLKSATCLAIAFVILFSMLPGNLSSALAAGNDFVVSGETFMPHFYSNFADAWNAANSVNGTIEMQADAKINKQLKLGNNHTVTINMNGYMIDRGNTNPNNILSASDSDGDGTIFLVGMNSKLIINGGNDAVSRSRAHNGRLISGVWYYDNNGSEMYKGAVLTGSASDSYWAGAISLGGTNAYLEVHDVTFAGNVCDTWAGSYGEGAVIKLVAFDSKVRLENCQIHYNYARDHGAGIAVLGNNARLELLSCDIAHNKVNENGAAIYVKSDAKKASIDLNDSRIYNNIAKNGGAIYIDADNCTINGGTFESNRATEDGGAIYLHGIENAIRNVDITYNEAGGNGGGVYVRQEDCSLADSIIMYNKAGSNGGGVYQESVNYVYVPKLYLNGKLTITENTVNSRKNNLYLVQTPNTMWATLTWRDAKIVGVPSRESEIWVTSGLGKGIISYIPDSYDDSIFHSDNPNYNVYWGQDKANEKEYRHLVIGTGTPQTIALPSVTINPGSPNFTYTGINKLEPTDYHYENWPVYKGYGREDGATAINAYYFSDGYFQTDATKYNEHLATLSLRMAAAGFNSGTWKDTSGFDWKYKLQSNHVKQMLSDIGVADDDIYLSDSYFVKPETDSIACAIGSKKLLDATGNDSGLVLVPIVVRGQGYEREWASNVTLGKEDVGMHKGFNEAATTVFSRLNTYMDQHPDVKAKLDAGKVRFWVVGFSRAGATANLTSKKLIDAYQSKGNVIYGYTLEAPQGGVEAAKQAGSDYSTIHNVILPGDLVPNVAMISMGFMRFGVDHYLPGTATSTPEAFSKRYYNTLTWDYPDTNKPVFLRDNTALVVGSAPYEAQKKIMLQQLAASDPTKVFDDYFHLATVGMKSTTEKQLWLEVGSSNVTMESWLADFTYYLNEWLVNTRRTDARDFYVMQNEEDTLRKLMDLTMGGSKMNLDRAKERALNFPFIAEAYLILGTNVYLDTLEKELLDLCFEKKVFADDAIPLSRREAEALIEIVCRVVWGDMTKIRNYSSGTTMDYGDDGEYLVMLPTLLYNAERILLNHMPSVVFAWLRSYDSYYTQNHDGVSDHYFVGNQAERTRVAQPYLTYEVNGKVCTMQAGDKVTLLPTDKLSNLALHNAEKNQGGMIFYDIANGGEVPSTPNTYYASAKEAFGPEYLPFTISNGSAVIKAKTIWHDTPSGDATFSFHVANQVKHYAIDIGSGIDTVPAFDFSKISFTIKLDDGREIMHPVSYDLHTGLVDFGYYPAERSIASVSVTPDIPGWVAVHMSTEMRQESIALVTEYRIDHYAMGEYAAPGGNGEIPELPVTGDNTNLPLLAGLLMLSLGALVVLLRRRKAM